MGKPRDLANVVATGNILADGAVAPAELTGVTSTAAEINILDGVTATAAELNLLDGVTATTAELNYVDGVTSNVQTQMDTKAPVAGPTFTGTLAAPTINASTALQIGGTAITATAAELNKMDGVTVGASDINSVTTKSPTADPTFTGTATAPTINASTALQIGGVAITSTAAELNILDGVTSTASELNILDGVTSTAAELNILDGVTATAAELNYVDGVTSAIQTQLNAKAPTASPTLTGTATVNGTLDIEEVYEKVTVQTSTTGTITFDTAVQAVELYTANQTANRTINFSNVNANLAIGQSLTVAIAMTQGSTAYYLNAYQVDGSSVTPKWQGGSAPTEGNASSIDSYSFTIVKTADATFTVLASITQYA